MNANQLGSALRDVIVKWSDGKEEVEENIANNQVLKLKKKNYLNEFSNSKIFSIRLQWACRM